MKISRNMVDTIVVGVAVLLINIAVVMIFPSVARAPKETHSISQSVEKEEQIYDLGIEPPPVVIGQSEKKVYVRDSYQLRVLSGAKVTWESSAPDTVKVDENGVVTALKAGKAKITATDEQGNSDECTIIAQKVAYLTIDDNPTVSMTPKFIDLFNEYDMKVTLFFCAQEGNDKLYEQFYQAGHTLAMHGFSHWEGKIYASTQAFEDNIEQERQFLLKATTAEYVQNVIRFPTGSGGHKDIRKVMLDKGFRVFDWTASYEDSYIETEQGCYDELMSGIDSDCEIILMHHKVASYQALPKTIETLREMGYEFAVITEETAMWYF